MIEIKVGGLNEAKLSLKAAISAFDVPATRRNLLTVMRFTLDEVVRKTPGSGRLKGGWAVEQDFRSTPDGFTYSGRVFNQLANEKLTYKSAISGTVRPKLDAQDRQQTYADIIPMLDRGTRPHPIYPRRFPVLVFRSSKHPPAGSSDLSNVVVTNKVSHPGTRAYGMLTQALAKLRNLSRTAVIGIQEQIITSFKR